MPFITKNKKHRNSSDGYTVVELMVSVALFGVAVLMAASAFLGVVSSNRKSLAMRTAIDNLNFAVESMSRDMKTGFSYHCGVGGAISAPQDCPSGASYIAFEGQEGDPLNPGDQIVYRLNGGRIERSGAGGVPGTFFPVTAPPPELSITGLAFRVYGTFGTAVDGARQPRIVIVIIGTAGIGKEASTFDLQTLISQRLPDV